MFKELNTSIQGDYSHLFDERYYDKNWCGNSGPKRFDSSLHVSLYIDIETRYLNANQRISFD